MNQPTLQYQRIKTFIVDGIDDGQWKVGARLPSENELASEFSLSRMTVNRALKELEADGVVERVQGKGTFVAPPRPLRSVLKIQGIDDEIRARGNEYRCRVLHLKSVAIGKHPRGATRHLVEALGIRPGASLFTSTVLHLENEQPIQLEQRWVKPAIWPDYLEQDFTLATPHQYLMAKSPFSRGQHTIEACLPTVKVRNWLQMSESEACLLIHRQTWVGSEPASYVKLYHPGSRFQLTTSLTR